MLGKLPSMQFLLLAVRKALGAQGTGTVRARIHTSTILSSSSAIQLLVANQVVSCPCMLPHLSRTVIVCLHLLTENILPWHSLQSPNTLIDPECFNWTSLFELCEGGRALWVWNRVRGDTALSCKAYLMVPKCSALGTGYLQWFWVSASLAPYLSAWFAPQLWALPLWYKWLFWKSGVSLTLGADGQNLRTTIKSVTPTINAAH